MNPDSATVLHINASCKQIMTNKQRQPCEFLKSLLKLESRSIVKIRSNRGVNVGCVEHNGFHPARHALPRKALPGSDDLLAADDGDDLLIGIIAIRHILGLPLVPARRVL